MPHSTAVESYASFQQYGLAPGQSSFLPTATHHTLQQHQIVQVTGVESHPTLRQPQQHLLQRQQQQQLPHHHQHSYGAGPSTATGTGPYQPQYTQGQTRKRSSLAEHDELQLDIQGLSSLSDVTETSPTGVPIELTPHGHHAQSQSQLYHAPPNLSAQAPQHHHHRLPNQPPSKMRRTSGYGEISSPPSQPGPSSVVGQEGMPAPAPRPRGPKLKFTPEDDQLLVDLKEKKNLTWKQIADFFPGRSSGTLQVRYCTKLKAKTTVWTDEMVVRLRNALREYENDKWRIISTKVGSGFSPTACKEKATELAVNDATAVESGTEAEASGEVVEEGSAFEHAARVQQPGSASSDPGSAFS